MGVVGKTTQHKYKNKLPVNPRRNYPPLVDEFRDICMGLIVNSEQISVKKED